MIYEPTYGNDKLCTCGHPYYRHFDTYDEMKAVGCKYCNCEEFKLAGTKPGRQHGVWFTSDTHYGHKRIIGLTGRAFESLDVMHEALIENWNAVVKPGDQVYHLGDFAFCKPKEATEIARRLNGQKFLVWGNHDKALKKSKEFMDQWVWCKDLAEIDVDDTRVVMCHYPMLAWNKSHHGSFHLHGHCHGSLKPDPGARRIDVGVDVWQYTPVSFEEIAREMSKKVFVPVDHHGARDEGK